MEMGCFTNCANVRTTVMAKLLFYVSNASSIRTNEKMTTVLRFAWPTYLPTYLQSDRS